MLVIREIDPDDAEAAAELSGELGYPVSPEEMKNRIQKLHALRDHVVYVAWRPDAVAGWIDVALVHHLQGEAFAEIGGLVVSEDLRSSGIGRELVAKAEQWARSRGITKVVVRSNIIRDAAHRFYRREGYQQTKTSAVFVKSLL